MGIQIHPMLQKTIYKENFEWIDFQNPSKEELNRIAATYNLHDAAIADCLEPSHLPKFEAFDNMHFIILRIYEKNCPDHKISFQEITQKIAIFFNDKLILSIHENRQDLMEDVYEKYISTKKVHTPEELVCKMIKVVLQSYNTPKDLIDEEVDFYEQKIFLKKRVPDLIRKLYFLKRRSFICEKTIYLTQMVINELEQLPNIRRFIAKDLNDTYLWQHNDFQQILEEVHNLLNMYLSLSSQRTNEVMRVLTAFSAIFLPLTFIVGVYGMNFENMPELTWKYGYAMSWGIMFVITLMVFFWFKKKGWF